MNTGLALLVSARAVTQKWLKAFGAIEKYEKDSILLFIIPINYYLPHIWETKYKKQCDDVKVPF